MYLIHATIAKHMPSIRRHGLQTSRCRGKIRGVWLHTPSRTDELLPHLARWHGVDIKRFRLLIVRVPRSWLRHHDGRKGIWICDRSISKERIMP